MHHAVTGHFRSPKIVLKLNLSAQNACRQNLYDIPIEKLAQ